MTRIIFTLVATTSVLLLTAHEIPTNLCRIPGVVASADSQLKTFSPSKSIDGDSTSKASRWVSNNDNMTHWLLIDFKHDFEVNSLNIRFWNDRYISIDFDIQVKAGDDFKTIRRVRNNCMAFRRINFPKLKTSAIRINFKRQSSDNMVRILEVEAFHIPNAIDATISGMLSPVGILTGAPPIMNLLSCEPDRILELDFSCRLLNAQSQHEISRTEKKLRIDGKLELPLPVPPSFGTFIYECNLLDAPVHLLYIPPSPSRYRSASPFGAHYHSINPAFIDHAGIYWWRNHDVYGRWNYYQTDQVESDWSRLNTQLDYVAEKQICECSVLIGAPQCYSTILPGEPIDSPRSWLYSYYPPSDYHAWAKEYVTPYIERVKPKSPFRAYEAWNEAWSYYRLRGLHGTPGEAMEIFRKTYLLAKKLDPESIVYATDIKIAMPNNNYTYQNFSQDILELGYLRYCDILSFHYYGLLNEKVIEQIRSQAWEYGRDLELWSTETATAGKPASVMLESLVIHRATGVGKTFIYTGSAWAPLMQVGKPTLYLAALATLCRTLGDALPLGSVPTKEYQCYLFANGSRLVAVFFSKNITPQKLPLQVNEVAEAQDMFGNKLDTRGNILSAEHPIIVFDPGLDLARKCLANRIETYVTPSHHYPEFKPISSMILASSDQELENVVIEVMKNLHRHRISADSDYLYYSNQILDLLTNCQIYLTRTRNGKVESPCTIATMREDLAQAWSAVLKRTGGNAILPNTERLLSHAQKEMQLATMYDSDGDRSACNLLLVASRQSLSNALERLPIEKPVELYKPKMYFRSYKRLIRSELYCFPNGQAQEAVITLANPLGHRLNGTLHVEVPKNWEIDPPNITYQVPALSRQLLKVSIMAPKKFSSEQKEHLVITDVDGNFSTISAELEILEKIPPYPVIVGPLTGGTYTGN